MPISNREINSIKKWVIKKMPNMINYYKLLIRLKELCKIVIEI